MAITRQSTGASVENNLVIGSRTAGEVGLLLFACPAGNALSSFRNNVFANLGDTLAFAVTTASVACDTRTSLTSIAALEQFATATAGASGVGGDARTAAAPGAIFTAWSAPQSGYPELVGLVSPGWKLAPSAPCSIVRGGYDVRDTLPADAYGTARTVPLSVGAEELTDESSCTP